MRLPPAPGLDWNSASKLRGTHLGGFFRGRRQEGNFPPGAWASSGQCWLGH